MHFEFLDFSSVEFKIGHACDATATRRATDRKFQYKMAPNYLLFKKQFLIIYSLNLLLALCSLERSFEAKETHQNQLISFQDKVF